MNVSSLHRCCRPLQHTLYLTTIICLISTQDKTFTLIKTCTIQKPVLFFFFIELQTGEKKIHRAGKIMQVKERLHPSLSMKMFWQPVQKKCSTGSNREEVNTPLKNTFGMSSWLETDWVVERRGKKKSGKKKKPRTRTGPAQVCAGWKKQNKTKPTLLNIHIS